MRRSWLRPVARDDPFREAAYPGAVSRTDRKDDVGHAGSGVGIDLPACIVKRKRATQQDRFLDGRRVSSDAPAMFLQSPNLVAEDLRSTERIPHLCMLRD